MLRPKSQVFKLKVMLIKLEAVNNKVAARCHAILRIDNNQFPFKVTPQFKQNIAIFNSDVEYEHFTILFDEVTGLFENRQATIVLELESKGAKLKMGEASINLGSILNEKKYRIVSQFPVSKCYDTNAKVKLSVDFIALNSNQQIKQSRKIIRETVQINNDKSLDIENGFTPSFKSRLFEQTNSILQDKLSDYEQKIQNLRQSTQRKEQRLHEQIIQKDQHISSLSIDLSRKQQQLALVNVQFEQIKYSLKELEQDNVHMRSKVVELSQKLIVYEQQEISLNKQIQSLQQSLETIFKTKENKEKIYLQQINKFSQKYQQSEKERNKIIFELESKLKEEIEKKQESYELSIKTLEKKYDEVVYSLKQKLSQVQGQQLTLEKQMKEVESQNKKLKQIKLTSEQQIIIITKENREFKEQIQALKQQNQILQHQLQSINFSYRQLEKTIRQHKQDVEHFKAQQQLLATQLQLANQTIDQHRKTISKYTKEIQVHKQREYYISEKYSQELDSRLFSAEQFKNQAEFYRAQSAQLKSEIQLAEQKIDEEEKKSSRLSNTITRLQSQINMKNQQLMRLNQQKITIELQVRNSKNDLKDCEDKILILKNQMYKLTEQARIKVQNVESDKNVQWSQKVKELQKDINEMIEKFNNEKQRIKQNNRKSEEKLKEYISFLKSQMTQQKSAFYWPSSLIEQQASLEIMRERTNTSQLRVAAFQNQIRNLREKIDELTSKNIQLASKASQASIQGKAVVSKSHDLMQLNDAYESLKISSRIKREELEATIKQLNQKLRQKDFEIEQIKFSYEVKIMQIEKGLPRSRVM